MFEEFFIIGVNKESVLSSNAEQQGTYLDPQVLLQWPNYPHFSECPRRKVVKDFCFPKGIFVKPLKLTGSRSELNKLIYGQSF